MCHIKEKFQTLCQLLFRHEKRISSLNRNNTNAIGKSKSDVKEVWEG